MEIWTYLLKKTPKTTGNRYILKINQSGFTIIETLIVLTIAGIFLLLVFEVIPSVDRVSRNSQRKADIGIILNAVSEYELKDSGNFPQSCGGNTGLLCTQPYTFGSGYPNDYFLRYTKNQLTYYTSTSAVSLFDQTSGSSILNDPNTETVSVYNFELCDQSGDGNATGQGADYSNVVALYSLENASGAGTPECQNI